MSSEYLLRARSIERKDTCIETEEKLCYGPRHGPPEETTQDYLIYFITGNPGCISYYQPFLSRLHSLLETSSAIESARFHICGHSFRGMEFAPNHDHGEPPKSPISLQEQINWQEDLLYKHVKSHQSRTSNKPPKVILMGHSVGSYILLELIQQHREKIASGEEDFDLIGGILLFPTITHIAKSPLGMVASVGHKCSNNECNTAATDCRVFLCRES